MTRETPERCNTRLYSLYKNIKMTFESIFEAIGVYMIHWMAVGVSRDWHRHGTHCNNGVTRAECWVCRAGCGDDGVRISGDNIHRLSQPSDARLRNMRHCLMSDGNKVSSFFISVLLIHSMPTCQLDNGSIIMKMLKPAVLNFCSQCDYQTKDKSYLQQHIKTIHEGFKYPCDQCDYKTAYRHHLFSHIKSKHEGVKYQCDQCDYKAAYKQNLLRHIKSIHKCVRYPCDQCDYKATQKANLMTHIKSKH